MLFSCLGVPQGGEADWFETVVWISEVVSELV